MSSMERKYRGDLSTFVPKKRTFENNVSELNIYIFF